MAGSKRWSRKLDPTYTESGTSPQGHRRLLAIALSCQWPGRLFELTPKIGPPALSGDDFRRKANRERKLMAKLNINGSVRDVEVESDTPLLWVIREQIGLTGTKYGCGVAQCGACSVHINDQVQRSCSIRVGDVQATDRIVTIEGLSSTSSHPVQKAWAAIDVPQCGYCQSGQIMAAAALLKKTPKPTDKDIDEAMTNICRCGTYQRIRTAVHMAAADASKG
jgi:isoquinoline 1-oxidoreductase alpha subunit